MSVTKTSQLMSYREIMAVCSEIHIKHINTLCGKDVELLNVKQVVHIVTPDCRQGGLCSDSQHGQGLVQVWYPHRALG